MMLVGNTGPTGLDELLKSFNLVIGSGLVLMDTRFNFNGNQALIFAPTSAAVKHPIVDPLGTNRLVLMPAAAPIHVFGQSAPGRPSSEPVDPTAGAGANPVDLEILVGREQSKSPPTTRFRTR